MKKETQAVEFKQSWRDEYLEWICGYANANGGTLFIGRADNGTPVGLAKAKSLMESIPCKITDTMGIIADVNLLDEGGKDVIEIKVEKYPSPISYHGRYFYRSGTTMRMISGKELDRLLLKQGGMGWDAVPMPRLKARDLDAEAIRYFREEAVRRKRLMRAETRVGRDILLENLHLVDEDGFLVRAAMLAFHRDPEKWVTGAYVKIGCFGASDSDLLYQDEVHGPLVMQADKVVELVYTKYLKALIGYEGIHRVEQYMFHKDAFREIVLNAIVHKDYAGRNPIQISVYPDRIYIWNDGTFPAGLDTAEKLFGKHSSKPFNPLLAGVFFKCGLIEAWGRGFDKIAAGCREYGGALPAYDIGESGVMVKCEACPAYLAMRERTEGRTGEVEDGGKTIAGKSAVTNGKSGERDTQSGETGEKSKETGGQSEEAIAAWAESVLPTKLRTDARGNMVRILVAIGLDSKITTEGMCTRTGMSASGVAKVLSALKKMGVIFRDGPDYGGSWHLGDRKKQ